MRQIGFALTPLLLFLTACTNIGFPSVVTGAPVLTYTAFGDSITAGAGLSDTANQAYVALIAHQYGLTFIDRAYTGDQACDIPTRQIFPYSVASSLAQPTFYTLLISTNDVDVKGTGPYEAVFNLCHQAALSWVALPTDFKVLATAASVVTTGLGHLESTNNWNAWTTDAANSSVTFPVKLATAGPVYAWYRIIDVNTGTFSWSIDQNAGGTVAGSTTTATTPAIATLNGYNNSLALLRLPAIPAGAHTITFTQTSPGAAGMGIVAVGVPPATRTSAIPRVLAGTTPRQLQAADGGSAACSVTDAPCLQYSADIAANVALLATDGLDVELFTTATYMQGATVDMIDSVHPNALGHTEIAHAIEDTISQGAAPASRRRP